MACRHSTKEGAAMAVKMTTMQSTTSNSNKVNPPALIKTMP
jgi:hypothetical protein